MKSNPTGEVEGIKVGKRLQSDSKLSPRLEDVAKLAGVSTATVSRVLNRRESVTEGLQAKVLGAVQRLGYVPHGAARALASRRSKTIGAIVPTIDNAIFSTSLQFLQERLSESGYTLLLASSDYQLERELKEVQALLERGVDGLILVGETHLDEVYTAMDRKQVPYVQIWAQGEKGGPPCVGFDNYAAALHLAQYLIDIGHRKIAMVAGITKDNDRAAGRTRGVKCALHRKGLDFHCGFYEERAYSIEQGRRSARDWLTHEDPPTAIICGNDILALGVLFECANRGISVPAAVSITGFDGLDITRHVSPALTTVEIPSAEMGMLGAEYLVARIEGRNVAHSTLLGTRLVVRETTAPPSPPTI